MTTFVQAQFPDEHLGVLRVQRGVEALRSTARRTGGSSFLMASLVAAALVVANDVVTTWTDGHLLAAWIVMWLLAFGALALFAAPLRRSSRALRASVARLQAARRQAQEDRQLWDLAMTDARVLADVQRAMAAQPEMLRTAR